MNNFLGERVWLLNSNPLPFGTHQSDNVKSIARCDPGGASQVTIEGNFVHIGYMYGTEGTSIIDV